MYLALAAIGIIQAVLLAVVLLRMRRGQTHPNRMLAALMLTIGLEIGGGSIVHTQYIKYVPHVIGAYHPLDFALAPFLYLYVRAIARKQPFAYRDLMHFLPVVLCAIYLTPYYLQPGDYKLSFLHSSAYSNWYYLRAGFAISIGSVYILIALKNAFRDSYREPQLRFLCFAFGVVLVGSVVRYLIDIFLPVYMPATNMFMPIAGAGFLYGMTYLGLRDPVTPAKYETSSLTTERSGQGLQVLRNALENEKVFLDPQITLNTLADKLRIPVPHLSQIINERLNQSFADLINRYRIEEVKHRFADPASRHYSILAIAEEVGFGSKSSFNSVFKKYTGTTPSEYRKTVSLRAEQ